MGLTNIISKIALSGIENDPRFQQLQEDYNNHIETSKALKEQDPSYSDEILRQYESYKTYSRYAGFFISLYGITGIAYTVLFFGSFFFMCSDFTGALIVMIGSFIGSIGYIISPLWFKFDYLDSFSSVRFILCLPILCFNILVFAFADIWMIIIPTISLLSLIVAFILNKVYVE